jgi:hypothetical protein
MNIREWEPDHTKMGQRAATHLHGWRKIRRPGRAVPRGYQSHVALLLVIGLPQDVERTGVR